MPPHILAILPSTLKPDRSAGDRRFFTLLQLLAKHYRVEVVTRWDERAGTHEATSEQVRDYGARLREVGVETVGNGSAEVLKALASHRYEMILFEFYRTAEQYLPICRQLQPEARLVTDCVDVHYLREESGVSIGLYHSDEARQTKEKEVSTYRRSDAVIVITDLDRDALQAEGEMPPLPLIPIVLETVERPVMEREREVVFVGGFGHAPNVDGILWFTSEIWEQVRAAVPNATLKIIGSNPTPEILALASFPGVTVEGFVPEVRPYLDQAAVSIAPLRFGGGMKGKVTEAMAHGLPIVTTSFGAQGYAIENGVHMIVADTSETFAEGVIELLKNPERAETMGRSGRNLMAEFCTPPSVEKRLVELVEAVIVAPPRFTPTAKDRLTGVLLRITLPITAALYPLLKRLKR